MTSRCAELFGLQLSDNLSLQQCYAIQEKQNQLSQEFAVNRFLLRDRTCQACPIVNMQ